jgi:uncharacterized protein YbgA (DUF1722 family)
LLTHHWQTNHKAAFYSDAMVSFHSGWKLTLIVAAPKRIVPMLKPLVAPVFT